jgi:hypothetical protein
MSEQVNYGSPGGPMGVTPRPKRRPIRRTARGCGPSYKKKRFIIPAAFVVVHVVAIAASSGGGKKSTSSSTASGGKPCAATYLDKQKKNVRADDVHTSFRMMYSRMRQNIHNYRLRKRLNGRRRGDPRV